MELLNRRPWAILSSLLALITITALIVLQQDYYSDHTVELRSEIAAFKAPKQNLWADLTEQEAIDINAFIITSLPHLNLTTSPSSPEDNSIFSLEVLRPNKTSAVPYLHESGESPPARYAKATLSETFDDNESYMVYYTVGPLPINAESNIVPLTYPFTSGRHYVKNPVKDYTAFAAELSNNMSDITTTLLQTTELEAIPRLEPDGSGVMWMQFYRAGSRSGARTLLPQGIYVRVQMEGWKIAGVYYNGDLYASVDALRSAMKDPNFSSTPPNLDGPWTETEDFESSPPGRELPPPVSIQPLGPRYRFDRIKRYVSWFGWEFYIATAQATGVSLFDIRFRGERIMYELGLQEAMAHYAGNDPMQGGLEFLDTFFGMGSRAFELVPGYDCPAYADYMDLEWHQTQKMHKQPNAICLFEFTADYLLSRHTAQYSVTASRNTFLTVRSVSTVGNYDYTIDYVFYLDGTLEVKVRASGFIFSAFYATNGTDEYGHRIHDALSSSMHDHVINFKADLDVAGPSNSMVRMALEPHTTTYPWDPSTQRNTMHLVEHPVHSETGLNWPPNSAEFYLILNPDEHNAWGERKGYRIVPGTGLGTPPHLTVLNSSALRRAAKWSERDVWVLKQKDSEPRSADPLNYISPQDPIIDFSKMADGEDLDYGDGEDLVLYFNVGAHHVPHSGDVPNTLHHTSASGVMFVPHNFADRDPSRASVQGVRLQLEGKGGGGGFADPRSGDLRQRREDARGTKARYFGGTYERSLEVGLEMLEPDLGKGYASAEHEVTDLGFNGSAAGVW